MNLLLPNVVNILFVCIFFKLLEGTAHYVGLLLVPAEELGPWPGLSLPFGQKMVFYSVLADFRPFLVFSSNLSHF